MIVAGELDPRKVALVPGNRFSVDVAAEKLAAGGLVLEPTSHARTTASEIEDAWEFGEGATDPSEGRRDVTQRLLTRLIEEDPVPFGIIVLKATDNSVDEKIGGSRRIHGTIRRTR